MPIKDMTYTRDINVGDYVNIPARVTIINEITGVLTLITVNPKAIETSLATLTNNQVIKS